MQGLAVPLWVCAGEREMPGVSFGAWLQSGSDYVMAKKSGEGEGGQRKTKRGGAGRSELA